MYDVRFRLEFKMGINCPPPLRSHSLTQPIVVLIPAYMLFSRYYSYLMLYFPIASHPTPTQPPSLLFFNQASVPCARRASRPYGACVRYNTILAPQCGVGWSALQSYHRTAR